MEQKPELTLEMPAPTLTLDAQPATPADQKAAEEKVEPVVLDEESLSEEERRQVEEFSQKIDLSNSTQVLQYGAASQKKVADFSETALNSIRTKDLGEVGDMITGLVTELKGFDATAEQPKGILGFFKKAGNQIEELKTRYAKAETNVERIEGMLQDHQVQLLKDIAMLDKMYEMNMVYYKELTMYIVAGKKKLADVRENQLPKLVERPRPRACPRTPRPPRIWRICARALKRSCTICS